MQWIPLHSSFGGATSPRNSLKLESRPFRFDWRMRQVSNAASVMSLPGARDRCVSIRLGSFFVFCFSVDAPHEFQTKRWRAVAHSKSQSLQPAAENAGRVWTMAAITPFRPCRVFEGPQLTWMSFREIKKKAPISSGELTCGKEARLLEADTLRLRNSGQNNRGPTSCLNMLKSKNLQWLGVC